ncbi:hypothetical protein [Antrihabitans sp. YC2-6]|uniref:hypothetical protein n=1 Tax=Antrihabitans sp. YC2-6 TaxID=2799498 RepID=UPI0018F4FA5E|nr:hypothetical protein [Antrihabitans sp. YC2-6]MBJ8348578.1 hypothetical protein [Antrihabitans sp. YC2-6]
MAIIAKADLQINPSMRGFFTKIKNELRASNIVAKVDVAPDMANFRQRLQQAARGLTVNARLNVTTQPIQVDLDFARARAQIAAFQRSAPRVTLGVDVNTAAANRQLARLARTRTALIRTRVIGPGAGGRGGNSNGGGLGGALLPNAAVLGLSALPATATAITSVTQSIGDLAKAGLVLPAVFAGIGAAVGTLTVGLTGMKDALSSDPEKSAEAFAKLSESAQNTVTVVKSFSEQWTELRKGVQNNLFDGIADSVQRLGDKGLPVLRQGMEQTASALAKGFRSTLDELSSDASVSDFTKIWGNVSTGIDNATGAAKPFVQAIRDIVSVGSEFLPSFGTGLSNATQKFANFIAKARETGKLKEWMQDGIDSVKDLGAIVKNVGSTLASIFKAADNDGKTFLETVRDVTERMSNWSKGLEGQGKLREFFENSRESMDRWRPVLKDIGTLLVAASTAAGAWSAVLMPFLSGAAQFLSEHTTLVQAIVVAWLATKTIVPIILGISAAVTAVRTSMAGLAAASGAAGLMGALGTGGLTLIVAGLAAGLYLLTSRHKDAAAAAEEQRQKEKALQDTLDETTGAVTEGTKKAVAQDFQDRGVLERAESFGIDTKSFNDAALGLNEPEKDRISQQLQKVVADELANTDSFTGRRGYGARLNNNGLDTDAVSAALSGVPEAVERYANVVEDVNTRLRNAGAKPGDLLPDLSELKNELSDVGESAATLSGEMLGTGESVANAAARARELNSTLNGTYELTEQGAQSFNDMGIAVRSVPDSKTVVIEDTTAENIARLQELGATVVDLPDGTTTVTLNDVEARAKIREIIAPKRLEVEVVPTGSFANAFTRLQGAVRRASGGIVRGPGSGTSDSIMAFLSNGEYVINSESTKRFLPLLELINKNLLPKFARGGLVTEEERARMGGGVVNMSLLEAVRSKYPNAVLTSAKTDHGVDGGYHPKGMAIDLGPDGGVLDFLWQNRDQLAQIIFDDPTKVWYNVNGEKAEGAEARAIYGESTMAQHGTHIHVAALSPVNFGGFAGGTGQGGTGEFKAVPTAATEQDRVVDAIIAEGRKQGISDKGIQIAIATAFAESGGRILANPNVPESLEIPHSGVGTDHDSVGPFQQRNSWGSAADRMDPSTSAALFYEQLKKLDYEKMDPAAAAQGVQGSAFADGSNYQAQMSKAQEAFAARSGGSTGDSGAFTGGRASMGGDGSAAPVWVTNWPGQPASTPGGPSASDPYSTGWGSVGTGASSYGTGATSSYGTQSVGQLPGSADVLAGIKKVPEWLPGGNLLQPFVSALPNSLPTEIGPGGDFSSAWGSGLTAGPWWSHGAQSGAALSGQAAALAQRTASDFIGFFNPQNVRGMLETGVAGLGASAMNGGGTYAPTFNNTGMSPSKVGAVIARHEARLTRSYSRNPTR